MAVDRPRRGSWPGRLVADASLSVLDGGRVLVGGSPLKVLRFARPIDLGHMVSPEVVDRLVDTGMAHPEPHSGPFTPDDVTVVIPVFGLVRALSVTLAALARMPEPCARIVVVDDASPNADAVAATVALAGRRSTRLIRRDRNGGSAAARNSGTEAVTTPLVAFVDAGCVPEPGWLRVVLAQFADPQVALVAPRVRADPRRWSDGDAAVDGSKFARRLRRAIARFETRRSSLDLGDRPARIAPRTRVAYVPSACVVARTDEIRRVGGFDETLGVGEDVDLVWRLARDRRLRYVPAGTATHDVRTSPRRWLGRRFAYGTSAASLAKRHPGAPVPVSVSPWSAAAWAGVAAGRPLVGAAIAGASTALLTRKLAGLEHPARLAVRLAGVGNVAAGGLLANAVRRVWWPVAVPAAVLGPKALRRSIVAAFVIPPVLEWRPASGIDPLTWLVLCTADDVAYGAGVWAGCVIERTIAPLVPDLSAGRISAPPPPRRNLKESAAQSG
jgi:mycofactocin system glycosyltransferase